MAGNELKPEVGHVLEDRYLLEGVIGEGGMGVVFAARHVELGETVAVKVLHPSSALDEQSLERFLREARLAARIKNEHVVRVLDVARGRGATPPYIVMEYLEGSDLADLVGTRGPLPPTEAVDYVLQACEALAEAHALGIVHRDLKPSNLLLTRRSDGTALLKVLDFGISKAHGEDDSKLTTTHAVFGSPAYMSPEQIRSAKHVDQRTDVWALAVVLFELLTARLPFVGDNASAILAAVSADPPLRLSQCMPKAPPGLEQAIEACLVKARDRRVADIAELAAMLEPFASPAGRVSVESVRRIALKPRSPIPSGAPSSGPLLPSVGIATTVPAPMGSSDLPARAEMPRKLDARTRGTDRGMVVNSGRSLKKRTPLVAAFGIALGAVALVGGTWAVDRMGRVSVDAAAPSLPTAPPLENPPLAVTVDPAAPALPPSSVPPSAPPLASAHPRVHGKPQASPRTPPAASSARPSTSTPPPSTPSPPRPNGNVDTDSRQ